MQHEYVGSDVAFFHSQFFVSFEDTQDGDVIANAAVSVDGLVLSV